MIKLKRILYEINSIQHLLEATGDVTKYTFTSSYPNNIALPVPPNVDAINSFDKMIPGWVLPELDNLVNTIKIAIETGKLTTGTIAIVATASQEKATTNVPDGYSQEQVNFSYPGGQITNENLAKQRALGIKTYIEKQVKLPEQVVITTKSYVASSKQVTVTVPIKTLSANEKKVFDTPKGQETFDLNPTNVYQLPSIENADVTGCNGVDINKSGAAGNPIAYRTKLQTKTGKISVEFSAYSVPDRLVIYRGDKVLKDTGYVSENPNEAQLYFGKILADLNQKTKNGYNGTISNNSNGNFTIDLGEKDIGDVVIDIYAPLGPSLWNLSVICAANRMAPEYIYPIPSSEGQNSHSIKIQPGKVYAIAGNLRPNGIGYDVRPKNDQEAGIVQNFVNALFIGLANPANYTPSNRDDLRMAPLTKNQNAIQNIKTFLEKIPKYNSATMKYEQPYKSISPYNIIYLGIASSQAGKANGGVYPIDVFQTYTTAQGESRPRVAKNFPPTKGKDFERGKGVDSRQSGKYTT